MKNMEIQYHWLFLLPSCLHSPPWSHPSFNKMISNSVMLPRHIKIYFGFDMRSLRCLRLCQHVNHYLPIYLWAIPVEFNSNWTIHLAQFPVFASAVDVLMAAEGFKSRGKQASSINCPESGDGSQIFDKLLLMKLSLHFSTKGGRSMG